MQSSGEHRRAGHHPHDERLVPTVDGESKTKQSKQQAQPRERPRGQTQNSKPTLKPSHALLTLKVLVHHEHAPAYCWDWAY